MRDIVGALKRWLSKPGNTQAGLAAALGYRSSTTVAQWIKRGRIPDYMHKDVWAQIKGKKK